ncbi:FKBP-type peptidyl-prolyl cis-trans isomerase [Hymenobacter rubripertinctus]|uniref:Peptidyl-prolyl cis-trans isomerase n=1 Tax=Hymenobacter rubripertinctus TaxID=2029981 RepID=A0A418R1M3_9BACT|nr:FKBP-type peptidyl-prolyl cis-trans isomerase [Hymenobacter rubripertinctus]RIY11326.1 FKBP-type peptidyl-prolyl cis-trans isomerase [Hymenobacter rubripertinctus]
MRYVVTGGLFLVLSSLPLAGWAQRTLTTAVPPPADSLLQRATTTPSGLRYTIRQVGTGPRAQPGSRVVVHYTGFLAADGHLFDTSVQQGGPLKVRAGRQSVIAGFDEALLLLPEGSRARVWIPADLAYGAKGRPDPDDETEKKYLIPPNADLIFELEILKVK